MKKSILKRFLFNVSSFKIFLHFLIVMFIVKIVKDLMFELEPLLNINDDSLLSNIIDLAMFIFLGYVFTIYFIKQKEHEEKIQIENRKVIENMAYSDSLTGLGNRAFLEKELSYVKTRNLMKDSYVAVLFIDLDNFKTINDTYGHNIGDTTLRIISKRLKYCLRDNDIICRNGGDEFVIILEDIKNKSDVEMIADKIIKSVASLYSVKDHKINLSASIGIKLFKINDSTNFENHIIDADKLMYTAKNNGKNSYIIEEI